MSGSAGGRYVGPYRIEHSRTVYENPWLKVREDRVVHRDGLASTFGVVMMRAGVSVLPLEEDGTVHLVREFKYALGLETLEVVSGALEPGEDAAQAGLRELHEECGLTAAEWVDMGALHPFTTIVHSPNHMFLARGLTRSSRRRDPRERVEVVRLSFEDALYGVLRGEITHGASCTLLLKTKFFLEREGRAAQRR